MNGKTPKIIIIGAGPCGLGAAWRLQELGYNNFKVFEKNSYPGGLASSFLDKKGFTWDIGGHVQFSHYKYFDRVMDSVLKNEWLEHQRESWIYLKERFLPYPFQYNIRYLPQEDVWKCIKGLRKLEKKPKVQPKNFKEWTLAIFGKGITELFMFPYNWKQWAYPLEKMSYGWIGERVAVADLKRILKNIKLKRDDVSWGPNKTFRFPLRGGTGEIWKRVYATLNPEKFFFGSKAVKIQTKKKYIEFQNGQEENYDLLITTIPLDKFILQSDLPNKSLAKYLAHSAVHVFGIGLRGTPPQYLQKKCWMYFPESNCPFFRVTIFSNYSPYNTPEAKRCWSLMAEVSESQYKKVNPETIKKEVLQGLKKTKFIQQKKEIVNIWHHYEPYGYPTPSLQRGKALKILTQLEKLGIYSRGRFGAWKYEVGNQDHSFMQGVETVNRILLNKKEITVWHPEIINK